MTQTGIQKAVAKAGSQSRLARDIDVGRAAVNKWLKQGYVPLARIDRIANMYGVPTWELCAPSVAKMLGRR